MINKPTGSRAPFILGQTCEMPRPALLRKTTLSCACLLSLTLAKAEIVDVFFLAGQSNASGRVSTGYSVDPRDAEIRYYYRTDGPSTSEANSGGAFSGLGPLASGYYGPEISMGRSLLDLGYNVAIVKVSDGGTNLSSNWNSTSNGNWWSIWKTNTSNALAALAASGHTVRLQGFFWMQGETDAESSTRAAAYPANFTHLVNNVSVHLSGLGYDASGMGFVTGLVRSAHGDYAEQIRDAQKSVMDAAPRGAWFDTNDLGTSDNLHYNAAGVATLGARFASTFASIPEPSTYALIMGASAVLVLLARKLRRNR